MKCTASTAGLVILFLAVVACSVIPTRDWEATMTVAISSTRTAPAADTPVPRLTSTATASPPVWLVYSDQDISFQYPKTLCGTSWQADWDIHSCDEDWRVERTQTGYSSSDYAGGKEDPGGAYIQIMPSYSTFGFEFGGDIQIIFISEDDFLEATQGGSLIQQTSGNGYSVFVVEGMEGYPGRVDHYYLTDNAEYLLIRNNFPDRYPKYISFLLDSIKLK